MKKASLYDQYRLYYIIKGDVGQMMMVEIPSGITVMDP